MNVRQSLIRSGSWFLIRRSGARKRLNLIRPQQINFRSAFAFPHIPRKVPFHPPTRSRAKEKGNEERHCHCTNAKWMDGVADNDDDDDEAEAAQLQWLKRAAAAAAVEAFVGA